MVSTTLMAGLLKKEHKGWIVKEHSKISLCLTSSGLLQDPHENSMSELDFNNLQLSFHMSVLVKGIEPTISNYVIKHARVFKVNRFKSQGDLCNSLLITRSWQHYSQDPRDGSNPSAQGPTEE